MWMIEHPGTEDEHESHGRGGVTDGSDSSCVGAAGSKSADRSSYLCSPGDIASADAPEMEEGFSERYFQMEVIFISFTRTKSIHIR